MRKTRGPHSDKLPGDNGDRLEPLKGRQSKPLKPNSDRPRLPNGRQITRREGKQLQKGVKHNRPGLLEFGQKSKREDGLSQRKLRHKGLTPYNDERIIRPGLKRSGKSRQQNESRKPRTDK